eukprot:UN01171
MQCGIYIQRIGVIVLCFHIIFETKLTQISQGHFVQVVIFKKVMIYNVVHNSPWLHKVLNLSTYLVY